MTFTSRVFSIKQAAFLAAAFVLAAGAQEANAWEPATTHAGLTEESALSADLHKRLSEQFGAQNGVYTMLTVPAADAPSLFTILRRLNPTHGYVPNAKGKMTAMGWLVAGSVVAEVPAENASNHFLDPRSGRSLTSMRAGSAGRRMGRFITGISKSSQVRSGGETASTWWKSPANSMGYTGFGDQFRKAVTSTTQGERDRHLAGALLAAGSMLHVLQDMGSPAHVRDDVGSQQEQVGTNFHDRGSRFERIAALAFGRLGIPRASATPTLPTLDAHFSNAAASGLADIIESNYFSNGTLPRTTTVKRDHGSSVFRQAIVKRLQRPAPSPHSRLDVVAARNAKGATWRNEEGVCLARYRLKSAKVNFWIDDDCALEQLEAILPAVAAFGTSFLQRLFPSDITVAKKAGKLVIGVESARYAEGTISLYAEAVDGIRTEIYTSQYKKEHKGLAQMPMPPRSASRITVLFDGKDALGETLLATRSLEWPLAKKAKP
jgi:hypothetical protein